MIYNTIFDCITSLNDKATELALKSDQNNIQHDNI